MCSCPHVYGICEFTTNSMPLYSFQINFCFLLKSGTTIALHWPSIYFGTIAIYVHTQHTLTTNRGAWNWSGQYRNSMKWTITGSIFVHMWPRLVYARCTLHDCIVYCVCLASQCSLFICCVVKPRVQCRSGHKNHWHWLCVYLCKQCNGRTHTCCWLLMYCALCCIFFCHNIIHPTFIISISSEWCCYKWETMGEGYSQQCVFNGHVTALATLALLLDIVVQGLLYIYCSEAALHEATGCKWQIGMRRRGTKNENITRMMTQFFIGTLLC